MARYQDYDFHTHANHDFNRLENSGVSNKGILIALGVIALLIMAAFFFTDTSTLPLENAPISTQPAE